MSVGAVLATATKRIFAATLEGMTDGLGQSAFLLQAVVAFGGGIMSFISPCVLPLLPGYLAMMSGYSTAEITTGEVSTSRMLGTIGLFIAGFTLVFAALGASATSLSQFIRVNLPDITRIAGIVIIVAGLLIVAMAVSDRGPLAALYRERRFQVRPSRLGGWAPPVMGMAFAFGWTPCIGPILTVVLATAAAQGTVGRGIGLLVAYSLGLGVPFLISGLGLMKVFTRVRRWLKPINIASGVALALFGVVMVTGNLAVWSAELSRWFLDVPFLRRLANV
ncbi:MAG: cytochrome c biogenesis CcdA family protein [Acidimicrobiia bacterium]